MKPVEMRRLLETISGEEALSLRAVARQAGVAPQSVYLHFADRRELMSAVYAARFGELSAELASAAADSPRARVTALARVYLDFAENHQAVYDAIFQLDGGLAFAQEDTPEPLKDAFAALDRKSTRLNSSHIQKSRMPSSA